MKRYLSLLAILLALPNINNCSAQAIDSARVVNSLNRCWRSFSHEYSTIYGLEDEEIKRYAKQKVCFSKDSISMYLNVVYKPTYMIKKVNAEEYAKSNFDCSKQRLSISTDSVIEITISSHSKPNKEGVTFKMTDFVVMGEECIYIMVDGVIFKLFDADAKAQPRGAN